MTNKGAAGHGRGPRVASSAHRGREQAPRASQYGPSIAHHDRHAQSPELRDPGWDDLDYAPIPLPPGPRHTSCHITFYTPRSFSFSDLAHVPTCPHVAASVFSGQTTIDNLDRLLRAQGLVPLWVQKHHRMFSGEFTPQPPSITGRASSWPAGWLPISLRPWKFMLEVLEVLATCLADDVLCPLCGGILDRYGDHLAVCLCGDREL